MLTLTFIGSLPSGTVRSADGRETITFARGEPVKMSVELGRELVKNSPGDWKVDDASADVLQKEILDSVKKA